MDFSFSEEEKMFQTMARDFVTKEVAPLAAEWDEKGWQHHEFPFDVIKKMADVGICAAPLPKEYGGRGEGGELSEVTLDIATEELSRGSGGLGVVYLVGWGIGIDPIFRNGAEEQKAKYGQRNAKGEIAMFGLTEPSGGSDVARIETRYTRQGDYYVLNGSKNFITNGAEADFGTVYAISDEYLKANPDPSKRYRGITAFIVEKDTPGYSVGRLERKMGVHPSSTAELHFEDCKLPAGNLLGQEGKGFRLAIESIDASRCSVAIQGVGIAEAAFDVAVEYTKEREAFGKKLAEHEGIQFMIADMATDIEAARLLIYYAAWLKDTRQPYFKESAMGKLLGTEAAHRVCHKAVQIFGGYGYMEDFAVNRFYRDQRITEIYEGTSEMQRWTISRLITGMK